MTTTERNMVTDREVLAELLAIEDLKASLAQASSHAARFSTDENYAVIDRLQSDLGRRKPIAWAAARARLALPEAVQFQQRMREWAVACFGESIADDKAERNHRFLEEALELVQSLGCSKVHAHELVNYVYGRPVGEPRQEVGGSMTTLSALCSAQGIDMMEAAEAELARVWTKIDVIRAKQAAKPKGALPTAQAPELSMSMFASKHDLTEARGNEGAEIDRLRWALARVKLKAASLADAQVIALDALAAPQINAPATTSPVAWQARNVLPDGTPDYRARMGQWKDCAQDEYELWKNEPGIAVRALFVHPLEAPQMNAPALPVAYVPVHPRHGPLWTMTTDNPHPARLPSYPLMPLYSGPINAPAGTGKPDDLLLRFLHDLHSHLPEVDRPASWSDFSDEQALRARQAWSRPWAAMCDRTADTWQPIETCPQDGYVLVHEDEAMRALLRIGGKWQSPGYPALVSNGPWEDVLVGKDAERLLKPLGYRLALRDGCCENPTHWMPMPSAPAGTPALPSREVTGSPGAPVNAAAQEHGRMPSALVGTGVGQTDDGALASDPGMRARNAEGSPPVAAAPDPVGWLVFLHEPDAEYRIYENKRDAETAAMERGEVAHAVYLAQEPPVAVAPVMPPQPKHDRSPMEDALYQARTMAAFFLQAYCPEGEELEAPDARSMAGYEYHRQRLIEAIERYAASTKPLAEALGSDQQGNRASQEPPVAVLAALGLWALQQTRGTYVGSDINGGELQDKAEELGLLVHVEVTEPCGEECLCADYDDFPQQCLRYSKAMSAAPQQEQTP